MYYALVRNWNSGSFGPNFIDTSFGSESVYENGPLNMGYERYANLAPAVYELQTFGYAAVTEDGVDLVVKLMSIDGSTLFEKTLVAEGETSATSPSVTDNEPTDGEESDDEPTDDEESDIENEVEDLETLEEDLDSGCNLGVNSYLMLYVVGVLLGIVM